MNLVRKRAESRPFCFTAKSPIVIPLCGEPHLAAVIEELHHQGIEPAAVVSATARKLAYIHVSIEVSARLPCVFEDAEASRGFQTASRKMTPPAKAPRWPKRLLRRVPVSLQLTTRDRSIHRCPLRAFLGETLCHLFECSAHPLHAEPNLFHIASGRFETKSRRQTTPPS